MTSRSTHIYCDDCECVQPMVMEPADEAAVGDKFTEARVLQCGKCGAVIAITYVLKTHPQIDPR
jgi:aerobic-type carbon monoxide dehydrogenase small subunit (CoxS/CutS family)